MQPVPPTGHWHEDYERGRPGWPMEVLDVAGLPPTATVLDLGAGTGKLTRLLVPRFSRVICVEPDEAMRGLLSPLCPSVGVLPGSAEDIPLAEASVDGVFVAEAFHGFDDERALRQGPPLVGLERRLQILVWHNALSHREANETCRRVISAVEADDLADGARRHASRVA